MSEMESVVILHGSNRDQYWPALRQLRKGGSGMRIYGFTDTPTQEQHYPGELRQAVMNIDTLLIADDCLVSEAGHTALNTAFLYGAKVEVFTDDYQLNFDKLKATPYWEMANADRPSQGYAPE